MLGADILIHQPCGSSGTALVMNLSSRCRRRFWLFVKTFHNYNEFIIESRSTKEDAAVESLGHAALELEWLPLITGITFHMPVVTESAL